MNFIKLILPFQWIAGISLISLAIYLIQFRNTKIAKNLIVFFLLTSLWCIGSALVLEIPGLTSKIFINRIKLISAILLPTSILFLSIKMNQEIILNKMQSFLIILFPSFFILVVVSPWHDLFITKYELLLVSNVVLLKFENGMLFFLHNIFARIYVIASLYLIYTGSVRTHHFHKKTAWLLLISILIPFLIDSIGVFFFAEIRYLQLVPISLALTAGLMTYMLFIHGSVDLVPLGRSMVVSSLSEPCLMWDKNGKLIDCNDSAIEALNISKDLKKAKNYDYLKHNEKEIKIKSSIFNIKHEAITDGKGQPLGSFSILQDQTKIFEDNEIKTKLMSVLSHDVHGHIGQMVYLTETMLLDRDKLDFDQSIKLSEGIYLLSKDLNLFMGDIIEWSREQYNGWKVKPESVLISEKIQGICHYMNSLAKYKNIKIVNEVDKKLIVTSDSSMLEIILRNLIYNSVKHSPNGSEIKIDNDKNRIIILNKGECFDVDRVNLYFYDDKIEHSSLGTQGLGYRLCKEFAKKLNIQIRLRWSGDMLATEIFLKL